MRLSVTFRALSLIAYAFIFIPGWFIAIPFILHLTIGLVEGPYIERVIFAIADISLITLIYQIYQPMSWKRLLIESIAFILMLIPFI